MSWQDSAIRLYKRFGAPAKFAAKMVLGAVLPGSPAVVDLIDEILDCVHETTKDQLIIEDRSLTASADDLQRVEDVLAVLAEDLSPLVAQVAALEKAPELAAQVLDVALATDERCQTAVRKLDALARRFDRLEKQNNEILKGQGYATAMLREMLPLMQRLSGVGDFVTDLHAAHLRIDDFRACLHEFQEAARAFSAGRIAEAGTQCASMAQAQPMSSAAAAALAAVQAAGQDFLAAEQSITRAARLRPDDAELAELHRRVTVASRGATPRQQSTSPGASRQPPKVGDSLDGWRLDLLLGHGGWGRVFKASRGSEVRALKVMHPELSRDPLFVERFKKEILTLAGLRGHKNLVAIHNFGYAAEAECWYFVMELIEGTSLEYELQARGALSLLEARPVFLALAEGLAVAHARDIIHRDIKPANILIRRDGTPVLVDFGLAAVTDDKGLIQGYTEMFAAPEQLRGRPADARSDIYSLAASLYYALVYDKPEHREPDQFEAEHVPEVLRELLTDALHHKPEHRPRNAAELRHRLEDLSNSTNAPSSLSPRTETLLSDGSNVEQTALFEKLREYQPTQPSEDDVGDTVVFLGIGAGMVFGVLGGAIVKGTAGALMGGVPGFILGVPLGYGLRWLSRVTAASAHWLLLGSLFGGLAGAGGGWLLEGVRAALVGCLVGGLACGGCVLAIARVKKKRKALAAELARRGRDLMTSGQHGEALKVFRSALAYNSQNSYVLINLAWLLLQANDKAIRDPVLALEYACRACLLPHIRSQISLRLLASVMRILDQQGDSSSLLEQSLESNPKATETLNNLAWLNATSSVEQFRDGGRAIRLATKACELTNWEKAYTLDTLAASYAEAGQFGEAILKQQQAINLAPKSRRDAYHLRLRLYELRQRYRVSVVSGSS